MIKTFFFVSHDYFLLIGNNQKEVVFFLLLKLAVKDFVGDRQYQNVTKKTVMVIYTFISIGYFGATVLSGCYEC